MKRWIFVGLLVALIVGTMIGHAHAAPPAYIGAEQSHEMSWEDSPLALQQKLGEISKGKRTPAAAIWGGDLRPDMPGARRSLQGKGGMATRASPTVCRPSAMRITLQSG